MVPLNPLRHGVLSQTPVIPLVERFEDWEKLRLGVILTGAHATRPFYRSARGIR